MKGETDWLVSIYAPYECLRSFYGKSEAKKYLHIEKSRLVDYFEPCNQYQFPWQMTEHQ